MRLSPYFSVGLALISLEIDAFSPLSYRVGIRLSVAGHGERNYRRSSFIHRSTAASDSPETKRKDAAVQALEKLLDRQKAEVEDTQTLLTQLKKLDLGKADAQTMNRAASVLSGVDYGFVSRSEGAAFDKLHGGIYNATTEGSVYEKYGPPANIIELGVQQFMRNLNAIKGEYKDEADVVFTPQQIVLHEKLQQLTLNSTAIWDRELADGPLEAPWIIKLPYLVLCYILDTIFEGKYVPSRFFLLETVARMPYFSYITMLHLYETLGFWRRSSDVKRIHFAEEWNEFNHLLIMESIGGDQQWWVRFMAQHSAVVYYLVLNFLWAMSPTLAYKFSELLEGHAVNTYGQFLDENEELLKELPPSKAAINYYSFGFADPLFGEYQTTALSTGSELRKPGENMQSMYDVFAAIQADEGDHVGTMKACLDPDVAVQSPSIEQKVLSGAALVSAAFVAGNSGMMPDIDVLNGIIDAGSNIPGFDTLVDAGSNVAADGTTVDVAAGAGAAFFSQFFEEDNEAGLAAEAIEGGALMFVVQTLQKFAVEFFTTIVQFLAALL